jgi:hypothetical protein
VNKKVQYLLFVVILVVLIGALFFLLKLREQALQQSARSDELVVQNSVPFPLIVNPDGGYDFRCLVKSKNGASIRVTENIFVRYSLECEHVDAEQKVQTLLVPLAIVNLSNNYSFITGYGTFNSSDFTQLALMNMYSNVRENEVFAFSFSPDVNDYRDLSGLELSAYNTFGDWVYNQQTSTRIASFVETGNIADLPKLNDKPVLFPFYAPIEIYAGE